MKAAKEVCFTISELAGSGKKRRRVVLKPVWLNKQQLIQLATLLVNDGELEWCDNAKAHRELREKGLVIKLHKGHRFYWAALSEDGRTLASAIAEASKHEGVES